MIVTAKYISANMPERFRGNPLIEALPAIVEPKALLTNLVLRPQLDLAASRALPAYVRMYDVECLKELYIPPPVALDFAVTVDQMLRSSYANRNPCSRDTQEWLHSTQDLMRAQGACRDTLEGMAFLMGGSGRGKSRLVRVVLSRYPQCIRHLSYKEKDFNQAQVVWIRAEVPSTGSLKSLFHRLFGALDAALGQPGTPESYVQEHLDSSVETMVLSFARAAKNHHLGILHIDDLQRCMDVNSGRGIVKFIIQLASALQCPVIFSSTEEVMAMFEEEKPAKGAQQQWDLKKFESARRAIKEGSFHMPRAMSADDPFYTKLFLAIMKWQWPDEPMAPDDELKKFLFDMTVSIPPLMIFLHIHANIRALMTGAPRLKLEHYGYVYRHRLRPLRPMLHAMRKGLKYDEAKFEAFLKEVVDSADAPVRASH